MNECVESWGFSLGPENSSIYHMFKPVDKLFFSKAFLSQLFVQVPFCCPTCWWQCLVGFLCSTWSWRSGSSTAVAVYPSGNTFAPSSRVRPLSHSQLSLRSWHVQIILVNNILNTLYSTHSLLILCIQNTHYWYCGHYIIPMLHDIWQYKAYFIHIDKNDKELAWYENLISTHSYFYD